MFFGSRLLPEMQTGQMVSRLCISALNSNGTFSYSYLNDGSVLQIEYAPQGNADGYDGLIVKEKIIVARASAPTRYSALLSGDLP